MASDENLILPTPGVSRRVSARRSSESRYASNYSGQYATSIDTVMPITSPSYDDIDPTFFRSRSIDNVERFVDMGGLSSPPMSPVRDRTFAYGDSYDELIQKINRMIANKHGHDYIWESYIRRFNQINESKGSESATPWSINDNWLSEWNTLDANVSSYTSNIGERTANIGDRTEPPNYQSTYTTTSTSPVYGRISPDFSTRRYYSRQDSDDMYTDTLEKLKKMRTNFISDIQTQRDIIETTGGYSGGYTPMDYSSKSYNNTDLSFKTYFSDEDVHNTDDCNICDKLKDDTTTETVKIEENTTSNAEGNAKETSSTSSTTTVVTETVENKKDGAEMVRKTSRHERKKSTERKKSKDESAPPTKVEESETKTVETTTVSESNNKDGGSTKTVVVEEKVTKTDEGNGAVVVEKEVNKEVKVDDVVQSKTTTKSVVADGNETKTTTTSSGEVVDTVVVKGKDRIRSRSRTNSGSKTEIKASTSRTPERTGSNGNDNSEEIIERLKTEIREAVGLTMKNDKKEDKKKRKSEPAPPTPSRKSYEIDLDLVKKDDRRRSSVRREGSLNIDLTKSDPPRRKSESIDSRVNRTMFETVIDNELQGDDWESTIENLRRECQKLGPDAPKLPHNDPRDKLKALMKIAEARWKYMTWLMAEASPEDQEKYKKMREKKK